ncbi:hypothetical protein [Chondromyces apiculatus]|uniref:Uncharacterized protein n=1 Tax=Chondromyces apiculatus DSM 436 TaxID=1192034 RepID=A0A017TGI5_9BACT|nr:hypothetical protein [Chondromyces apiculatus]EYF07706.1 Hypothetical protein CAP_8207 [Chondromyces apiculatus DSM 436]
METQEATHGGHASYRQWRDDLLSAAGFRELAPAELGEVGRLVHGRAEDMALYGVPAPRMAAAGLRVLGRTALECTVDMHCVAIAEALYTLLGRPRRTPDLLVADLFCGSGNVGFHLGRRLGVLVQASELDARVHAATQHNLSATGGPVALHRADYRDLLGQLAPRGPHDTYVVAPPSGAASLPDDGTPGDTSPPLGAIVDGIRRSRRGAPFLVVLKTSARTPPHALREAFAGSHHLHAHRPRAPLTAGAGTHLHLYAVPH